MKLKKIIIVLFLLTSTLLNAAEIKNAKFLVVDTGTFEKIKKLNILNGGIEKKSLITSVRLKDEDILKFYPEYYLYNGENCTIINKILTSNSNSKKSMLVLQEEKKILKEIKKIKLIQLLNDSSLKSYNNSNVSLALIQATGVICQDKLLFRGKYYTANENINNIKIFSFDIKNSILLIKE